MNRIFKIIVGLTLAVAILELSSAGLIYHYYSRKQRDFVPQGSALIKLSNMVWNKVFGRFSQPMVTVDHGPLFAVDADLGFTILPGHYLVQERTQNEMHEFGLTVVANGRRASSYKPVNASKRMFILGDSDIFGWGLDDEQTVPWLLQARLPDFEVVNLAVNSYSTIQAMLLLQRATPALSPDDVVIFIYHPLTMEFSAMKMNVLDTLADGAEIQVAGADFKNANIPFGVLNAKDELEIRRVKISCSKQTASPECTVPAFDANAAARITELGLDKIMAMHQGRLVIGWFSGPDNDPVIQHARAHGADIADLREQSDAQCCSDRDLTPADGHDGPFATVRMYQRLLSALQAWHLAQ